MLLKQPLFRFIFGLIALIAILHILAIEFYLYWTLWWFDVLIHFLGGLWIGLSVLWFVFLSGYVTRFQLQYTNALILTLLSIIIVAVGWEVFEFFVESPLEENYMFDTITDLIMGTFGALSGYAYVVSNYIQTSTL